MLFKVQKKLICFDKKLVRRNPFTLKIRSNVWENFEGILGNPGEIPHAGCRVRGVCERVPLEEHNGIPLQEHNGIPPSLRYRQIQPGGENNVGYQQEPVVGLAFIISSGI